MPRARAICLVTLLSSLICACHGATDTSQSEDISAKGSWLNVCREQADCAPGMFCECGVCSVRCARDQECAVFSRSAVCASSIPVTSLCDSSSKLEPICVLECTSNSSCLALGERGVCSSEWCRGATADSVVDGGLLDCADQRGLIHDALEPTLIAADRSCISDSDCRRVSLSNACYGNGCDGQYVSRAAAEAITAKLSALEAEICPTSFKAGCTGPNRISCPLQRIPKCVAGSCEADN